MKAIYPGSFNPWHLGHEDILRKALGIFDEVVVARGINPEKENKTIIISNNQLADAINGSLFDEDIGNYKDYRVKCVTFNGLLVDEVKKQNVNAVIRGLRNGDDLQYEMNQQYWSEDLGLKVPIVYFICDRKLSHISSSMLRMVGSFPQAKEKLDGKA